MSSQIWKERRVSMVLWLPFAWLFLSASRGRLSPERLPDVEVYEGNLILRLLFIAMILVGLLVLFRRWVTLRQVFERNKWVVFLFLFMGLSIVWSDYPFVSFKRWVKVLGVLIMAMIMLTEERPMEAFKAVLGRFSYWAAPLSFVLIFLLPSYGTRQYGREGTMWIGIATHKNTLGVIVLLSAVYFTYIFFFSGRERKTTLAEKILFAMSLFLLAGCRSTTSLFAYMAAVGAFIIAGLGAGARRRTGVIFLYLFSFGLVTYLLLEIMAGRPAVTQSVVGAFGRDTTFTGRLELWRDVWTEAANRPILGHGFGGFWVGDRAESLWDVHDWKPIDSHNGYLDIFAELGLVGLILVAALTGSAYRRVSESFIVNVADARFLAALMIMILAHNLNETSLCSLNHPYWLVFLFMALIRPKDLESAAPALSKPEPQEGGVAPALRSVG